MMALKGQRRFLRLSLRQLNIFGKGKGFYCHPCGQILTLSVSKRAKHLSEIVKREYAARI